ncbi:hypothetical protein E4U19_007164 [Claviceps sp. Clav32 group G5]|nr:hypothetical protein E4U19_007164 [Claviceps sp. Clav32 group G5]
MPFYERNPGFGARQIIFSQSALAPRFAGGISRDHLLVLDESGSPSLQSFVGDQTFMEDTLSLANIDFILNVQQQAWADKYARGRVFDHDGDRGDFYCPEWDIYTSSFHQYLLQHSLGEVTFDACACFEADYDRALALPFSPDQFSEVTPSELPELTFPVVPVNLITGPWDEEKNPLLFWLAREDLDYVSNTFDLGPRAVEVKLACLDAAAISVENLDLLIANCLMGSDSWFFEGLPQGARHKRLDKLCNRIDRGGEVVDMDILRLVAASQGEMRLEPTASDRNKIESSCSEGHVVSRSPVLQAGIRSNCISQNYQLLFCRQHTA